MLSKKQLGRVFIWLGCGCIAIAALLLLHNAWTERNAQQTSNAALAAITQLGDAQQLTSDTPPPAGNASSGDTQTLSLDGNDYCGVLELATLGLTLPIQSEFSYPNLKSSPCVYETKQNEALVIAAHNYAAHFGALPKLAIGDTVCYTPIGGEAMLYTVSVIDTVEQTELDAVHGTADELILFTCNINKNTQRIIVRCSKKGGI